VMVMVGPKLFLPHGSTSPGNYGWFFVFHPCFQLIYYRPLKMFNGPEQAAHYHIL
jgi:hypothetical protein